MSGFKQKWSIVLATAVSMAMLSACGDEEKEPSPKGEAKEVKILAFSAAPQVVSPGESSTLSWKTENAEELQLFAGDEELPLPSDSVSEGSVEVTPEATTKYALVAKGANGKEARAELTVGVSAEGPKIEVFAAEPAEILLGESSTLHWEVTNATAIALLQGDEVLHESSETSGQFPVEPDKTTVYTLVAIDGELEVRADVTVEVAPLIQRFEVDPTLVVASPENPAEVTLSWQNQGAESIEIVAQPGGPLNVEGLDPNFYDVTVEVTETTVFTLVAHGAGAAKSSAEATVEVVGRVEFAIEGPSRVGAGDEFRLAWNVRNATSLAIHRNGEVLDESAPPSGELGDVIEEETTYLFLATDAAGTTYSMDWVVEVAAPEILSFEADSTRVQPGSEYVLSWETVGGLSLEIRDRAGVVFASEDVSTIASGQFRAEWPSDATHLDLELVIWNGSGEARASIELLAGDGPVIRSFEATPESVPLGEAVLLRWDVTTDVDGAEPTLTLTGPDGSPIAIPEGAEQVEVIPSAEGSNEYTLEASSARGSTTATVQVMAAVPPTVTLVATPEVFDPAEDDLITLTWTTTNAVYIEVVQETSSGQLTTLVSTGNSARVAQGEHVLAPLVLPLTFRATAVGPTGLTAEAVVVVDQAGVALNFTANPTTITGRETVTLSWNASGTASTYLGSVFVGGTLDPFIDISTDPAAYTFSGADYGCYADWEDRDDQGCVLLHFPNGFTFPFAGDLKTQARVYINGFVSFDATEHMSTNTAFELFDDRDAFTGFVHLSPFWNNLTRNAYEGPITGNIHYKLVEDDGDRYLIIQWSHMWTNFTYTDDPADLNFQVILWEDGSFDYRYGTMLASGSKAPRALGSEAAIGVRYGSGDAIQVFYREQVPGGLQNFGLRFVAPELPSSGEIECVPLETTTYTLYSEDGQVSEDVTVTVN